MASSLVASLLGGEVTGNHSKLLLLFKASTKKKHLKLLFSLGNQYFKKKFTVDNSGGIAKPCFRGCRHVSTSRCNT